MTAMISSIACIWAAVILPGTIFNGQGTSVEAAARANYSVLSVPIPGLFNIGKPATGFIPDVMAELGKAGGFDYYFTQVPSVAAFGSQNGPQKFTGAMATFLANSIGPNKLHIYAAALETESGYDEFVDFLTPLYQSNVTTVYNTKRVNPPPSMESVAQGFLGGLASGFSGGFAGIANAAADAAKNAVNTVRAWLDKQETVVLENTMTIDFLKDAFNKKSDPRLVEIANAVDLQQKGKGFPATYEKAAACVSRDDGKPCIFVGRTPAIENLVRDSKGKLALDKKPLRTLWGAFAVHKGDPALKAMLNAQLRELHGNGIMAARFTKWFNTSTFVPPTASTSSKYW